jgi:hypothetical protein
MTKGQHYTRHQQKIISRYYDHHDTIHLAKLGELVSDLAVCEDAKKADRLWTRVRAALKQMEVPAERIEKVAAARDVAALAKLAGELSGKK